MDISLLLNPLQQPPKEPSLHFEREEDTKDEYRARKRNRPGPEQLAILKRVFEETNGFPSTTKRHQLAQQLGFTPRGVQIWFQNRRQDYKKWKLRSLEKRSNASPPQINTHIGHQTHPLAPLTPFSASTLPPPRDTWDSFTLADQAASTDEKFSKMTFHSY